MGEVISLLDREHKNEPELEQRPKPRSFEDLSRDVRASWPNKPRITLALLKWIPDQFGVLEPGAACRIIPEARFDAFCRLVYLAGGHTATQTDMTDVEGFLDMFREICRIEEVPV